MQVAERADASGSVVVCKRADTMQHAWLNTWMISAKAAQTMQQDLHDTGGFAGMQR